MHWWTDSQYLSQCAVCVFATVAGDIICERCNIGVLSNEPLLGRCGCCVCPSVCLEAIKYTQEDHHGRCVAHHDYVFKCSCPEMCVSFGLRCLCGFKSLSHALLLDRVTIWLWKSSNWVGEPDYLLSMNVWRRGEENFLPRGRRKRSFWCGVNLSQQRGNKITYWIKGGYYGSSSVKYIFGTIHVMGITTLVTVLACKGLLISPLADFYFLVARVYKKQNAYACHINLFTCTKS